MTASDYFSENILVIPESKTFDRKSAKYDLVKLANTLISFANADGGTVALGIKEGRFEGLHELSEQRKNDIRQIGTQLIVPALDIEVERRQIKLKNGHDEIWLLSVQPADNKIYANMRDEVYLRIGDESHKVTYEERKALEYSKGIRAYESQTIPEALLEDLDSKMVKQYKKYMGLPVTIFGIYCFLKV